MFRGEHFPPLRQKRYTDIKLHGVHTYWRLHTPRHSPVAILQPYWRPNFDQGLLSSFRSYNRPTLFTRPSLAKESTLRTCANHMHEYTCLHLSSTRSQIQACFSPARFIKKATQLFHDTSSSSLPF